MIKAIAKLPDLIFGFGDETLIKLTILHMTHQTHQLTNGANQCAGEVSGQQRG